MGVRKSVETGISVVEAAEQRIRNVYANGAQVRISFSGGKDSIAVIGLVYNLIQRGEIRADQTTVVFMDEEAMYDCIIDCVKKWRKRMLALGCEFLWFCMEYRHYNCLNSLEENESFICWDRNKRDAWVRPMPSFAITSHPLFRPRRDTYQEFLQRFSKGYISMVGLRAAESHRRGMHLARLTHAGNLANTDNCVYPIYDWSDGDVYKYILDNGFELPEIYQYLWEIGTPKRNLRVSQFFSIDTAKSLVSMNEYYPDLMERVQRREPNAYLVALYIDSEMFRRTTANRKKVEAEEDAKDYKALFIDVIKHPEKYCAKGSRHEKVIGFYRRGWFKFGEFYTDKDYKALYEAAVAGDPKLRAMTAANMGAASGYNKRSEK